MLFLLFSLLFFVEDAPEKEPSENAFEMAETEWRAKREASLKSENSWFNVSGLFWLEEGANEFGTHADLRLRMPPHSTVERAGVIFRENEGVRFEMNRGQRATVQGEPRSNGRLEVGEILSHNHLRMFLIERGGRLALRIRDLRSSNFLDFKALDFYRPNEKFVIEAEFEPYDPPDKITISTVINTELEMIIPGVISFTFKGKKYELLPTVETLEDESYFIMLKDQTSGASTYGGGRFLYVDPPVDGKVTLNFNRLINPPCAYTAFATCPLPPAQNWLDLALEAGERNYKAHEDEVVK